MAKMARKVMSALTLAELVSRYCCWRFDLDEGTKYLYSRAVDSFEIWLGRETGHNKTRARRLGTWSVPATLKAATLRDLSDSNVCAWLAARSKVASKATLKRERNDLVRLWKWAAMNGWCRGPVDIPGIKLPRKVPRAYSVDQIALCIRICSEMSGLIPGTNIPRRDWWVALLLLIFDTGVRIGAALAVDRAELCLDRSFVVLSDVTAKTDCEQMLWLRSQTCAALRRLMSHSLGPNRNGPATGKLFPLVRSRSTVFAQFRRIRAKAGFPKERSGFHKIRKSHATYITATCGVESAARQLGHSTTAMTWSRYVDPMLLAENQPHAVDALPRIVVPGLSASGVSERQLVLF